MVDKPSNKGLWVISEDAIVEIHKPPNDHVIDEVFVGMSEDANGFNGIIATMIPGIGASPMFTSSQKALAFFKSQASMLAKEAATPIKIYRFTRVEVVYDTEKPVG
jgi:hypothetical protein